MSSERPGWDDYYMSIARTVATRSSCVRRRVGALIVVDKAIIATGYNGTPMGVANCSDGGCPRCASDAPPGAGYDTCVCVHAEQNAIVLAARHGNATNGGVLYATLRPCFGCTKELLQAKVKAVFYMHDWKHPDPDVWHEYEKLQQRFPGGIRKLEMEDPDKDWAVGTKPKPPEESGHSIPGN